MIDPVVVILYIVVFVFWISVGWRLRRVPVFWLAKGRTDLGTVISIIFMVIWIAIFLLVHYFYVHLHNLPPL